MPFVLLLLAGLLIVVAFNDTQGTLATELEQDIPQYFAWALAIVAILAIGFIPGMKTPSRWLLALVLVVLLLHNNNYQSLFSNIQTVASNAPQITGPESPATAIAQNPANPQITTGEIFGIASNTGQAAQQSPFGTMASPFLHDAGFNPNSYLSPFGNANSGFGGG